MATIFNQANLSYTYGATTANAVSNLASTERSMPMTVDKRTLESAYRAESELTFLILFANTGETPVDNLTATDDLGTFTPVGGETPVTPLTYVGPAELYLNGAFSATLSPVVTAESVTFTVPQLPAGASAMLLYKAQVNGSAPLQTGGSITNTVTVGELTASAEIPVEAYADVTIEKEMSPNPIAAGSTLTVTFTIENSGNTEATDLVLTDDFPLPVSGLAERIGEDIAVGFAGVFSFPGGTGFQALFH